MALPAKQKTWTISTGTTITYTSLVQVMREYLYAIKTFLLANGYTCKGSCDGTTGAMDAVDRWDTAAKAGTRAANVTTAVSWFVLVDGNGANICLSYVGASDDVARISFSPGGNYIAAGTPTHTPTATTDEQVILTAQSLINNSTSLDRRWFGWVDSEHKMCRFAVSRNGVFTGCVWGVEIVSSRVTGATFSPTVAGFGYVRANYVYTSLFGSPTGGSVAWLARANNTNVICGCGSEIFNGSSSLWSNVKTELQGAIGYPIKRLSIGTATSGAQGPVADVYDMHTGRNIVNSADGDTYGSLEWIQIGDCLWPWDGVTTPQLV